MSSNKEFNPLVKSYHGYIDKINTQLDEQLDAYNGSEFTEPLKYALANGKRIRPLILILAAECISKVDDNAYVAACAVEFLHTESVIHDDIIDEEIERRYRDPFHIKFGYNTSILTGDYVLGLILGIASKLDNARITMELSTTAMLMSEGEMIESRLETSEDVTFSDYLKVMHYKTATAFEVAAKLGGIISGGTEKEIMALAEYGKNIGIAYQIRDDLHDWKNEDKLLNLMIKNSTDPRDIFNKMDELLKEYAQKAKNNLNSIKESQAKAGLESLIDFTMLKA